MTDEEKAEILKLGPIAAWNTNVAAVQKLDAFIRLLPDILRDAELKHLALRLDSILAEADRSIAALQVISNSGIEQMSAMLRALKKNENVD